MNPYRIAWHVVRLPLYAFIAAAAVLVAVLCGAMVRDVWLGWDLWLYVRIFGVIVGLISAFVLWCLLMDWLERRAVAYWRRKRELTRERTL